MFHEPCPQSSTLTASGPFRSSPEIPPAINTHRSRSGPVLSNPILGHHRGTTLRMSSKRSRRDAGLKMLCTMSLKTLGGTLLQPIWWNPAPTCAPFNYCLVIAAWLPRLAICASPLPRCAPPPAHSICSRSRLPLSPSPLHHSTSSSGTWIAEVRGGGCVSPLRRSLSS